MRNKVILPILLIGLLVAACNNSNNANLSIISPSGAPALALYSFAINQQLSTNTVPSNVLAQLQSNNYDAVVFDFYNGLKSLKNNNGHYKLAKMLTGGNLYLVGINKDEEHKYPNKGDKVISFGENLIPDLVFKNLFGNSGVNLSYVASTVETSGVLLQESADYVVVAEPSLSTVLSKKPSSFKYTKVSLREEWGNKYHIDPVIPQAGLFINMTNYEARKAEYTHLMTKINENIDLGINKPEQIKEEMNAKYSIEEQKSIFSFNSEIMYKVQSNKNNGFGLVDANYTIDIKDFLEKVGIQDDFKEFIL